MTGHPETSLIYVLHGSQVDHGNFKKKVEMVLLVVS